MGSPEGAGALVGAAAGAAGVAAGAQAATRNTEPAISKRLSAMTTLVDLNIFSLLSWLALRW
jgi:hypothetical protein